MNTNLQRTLHSWVATNLLPAIDTIHGETRFTFGRHALWFDVDGSVTWLVQDAGGNVVGREVVESAEQLAGLLDGYAMGDL